MMRSSRRASRASRSIDLRLSGGLAHFGAKFAYDARPLRLRRVKREVCALEYLFGIIAVGRPHSGARANADGQDALINGQRVGYALEGSVDSRAREPGASPGTITANSSPPQAGHRCFGRKVPLQTPRYGSEKLVARRMPHTVVEELKPSTSMTMTQTYEASAVAVASACSATSAESLRFGVAGQRIVVRRPTQLLFRPARRGDVK